MNVIVCYKVECVIVLMEESPVLCHEIICGSGRVCSVAVWWDGRGELLLLWDRGEWSEWWVTYVVHGEPQPCTAMYCMSCWGYAQIKCDISVIGKVFFTLSFFLVSWEINSPLRQSFRFLALPLDLSQSLYSSSGAPHFLLYTLYAFCSFPFYPYYSPPFSLQGLTVRNSDRLSWLALTNSV